MWDIRLQTTEPINGRARLEGRQPGARDPALGTPAPAPAISAGCGNRWRCLCARTSWLTITHTGAPARPTQPRPDRAVSKSACGWLQGFLFPPSFPSTSEVDQIFASLNLSYCSKPQALPIISRFYRSLCFTLDQQEHRWTNGCSLDIYSIPVHISGTFQFVLPVLFFHPKLCSLGYSVSMYNISHKPLS